MKIGLLKCCDVNDELRDISGDYDEMFACAFGPQISFKVYDVKNGELPDQLNECEGYLITGSASSTYEKLDWIGEVEELIRRCHRERKKTVGICFGHQLIAQALDGQSALSDKGWGIACRPVAIKTPKTWMQPGLESYRIPYVHQDQVQQLPSQAELLGGNDHCHYGMYMVGTHILAIQGHPEFSADYTRALENTRKDIIPADVMTEAKSSYLEGSDNEVVIQWIINFFRENSKA